MSKIVGFLKDRVKTIHTVGCKSETVMRMFSYYLGQSVKILLNPRFCYVKYIWEVFTGNRHRTGLEFSTHRNHLGGGGLFKYRLLGPPLRASLQELWAGSWNLQRQPVPRCCWCYWPRGRTLRTTEPKAEKRGASLPNQEKGGKAMRKKKTKNLPFNPALCRTDHTSHTYNFRFSGRHVKK